MSEENLTLSETAATAAEVPGCGLYIILPDTQDHNKLCFRLGQALHAANRFSTYNINRHVVEYRPSTTNPAETAIVKAYQETVTRNGFIFLVFDDAKLAREVEADGILCSSVQKATEARKLMGEDAIIGLRCSSKAAANSALAHEFDFISIFSEKNGDSLLDILNWWTTVTENPVAVEGAFDQENCQSFVRGEATFIDASHHIWTHPSGNVMQGVVNMLDAFERYKPYITKVN